MKENFVGVSSPGQTPSDELEDDHVEYLENEEFSIDEMLRNTDSTWQRSVPPRIWRCGSLCPGCVGRELFLVVEIFLTEIKLSIWLQAPAN